MVYSTNTLALSERKNTFTLSLKKKKKKTPSIPPNSRDDKNQSWNVYPPRNIPSTPMNSIPQFLLDERIACIWTTVRMPIVHFSVLLVFKKFATHNTEQFQIQCAVTQQSKRLPPKSWQSTAQEFHR